ncbi:MAG: hypothetical protein JWO38_2022 [Gemmataceae bacterium]|nr:hypothetical protein [Gemmataceae bacterium]
MRCLSAWLLLCCAFAPAGCRGPNGPVSTPSYDADGMARDAIRLYDRNGNGTIDGTELDACPGLKPVAAADKDKALTRDELAERFRSYEKAGVGASGVACKIRLNGKPLDGANVSFVPEEFMQGRVKGAKGVSTADGLVQLVGEGGAPGLACGVYKITVSHKTADGTEQIPPRYNAQTTLGWEVNNDPRANRQVELNLKAP